MIKELAERTEFKEATQFAVKSKRMLDREYALRFLSFTELDYKKEYKGNIDNFLIKGLKKQIILMRKISHVSQNGL